MRRYITAVAVYSTAVHSRTHRVGVRFLEGQGLLHPDLQLYLVVSTPIYLGDKVALPFYAKIQKATYLHQMYPITHHNYTHNSQVKTSLHTHTTHLARDAVDATLHILTHRTRATDATARDGHAVRVPMGAMPTWFMDRGHGRPGAQTSSDNLTAIPTLPFSANKHFPAWQNP